jgi:hypothetical protein
MDMLARRVSHLRVVHNALKLRNARVRRVVLVGFPALTVGLVLASLVLGNLQAEAGIATGVAALLMLGGLTLDHVIELQDGLPDERRRLLSDFQAVTSAQDDRLVERLRPVPGVLGVYNDLSDTTWPPHLRGARRVEVVARFFNALASGEATRSALIGFFERGGELTVVTTDPRDNAALRQVTAARDQSASGPERAAIAARVRDGLRRLSEARVAANAQPTALRVHLSRQPLNWSGYCFDRRTLIFVPYEHRFVHYARAPRLVVDLEAEAAFSAFWKSELTLLTAPDAGLSTEVESLDELIRKV